MSAKYQKLNLSEMALINDLILNQRDTHQPLSFMWNEYNNLALKVQQLDCEPLDIQPFEMDKILTELDNNIYIKL